MKIEVIAIIFYQLYLASMIIVENQFIGTLLIFTINCILFYFIIIKCNIYKSFISYY